MREEKGERFKLRKFLYLGVLFVLLAGVSPSSAGTIVLDDFDRPDSTNMGPNWIEQAGDFSITSGKATGPAYSVMTYVGVASNSVTVDAYPNPSGQLSYVAILLGFADINNTLFLKVQNQNSSLFNYAAFYTGNNNNVPAWSPGFFALTTPFAAARFTATLAGDTVTLSFDTNFDGIADQVYSASGAPIGSLGTGIGIGAYGYPLIDNFSINDWDGQLIPEPGTFGLLAPALLLTGLLWRKLYRN